MLLIMRIFYNIFEPMGQFFRLSNTVEFLAGILVEQATFSKQFPIVHF